VVFILDQVVASSNADRKSQRCPEVQERVSLLHISVRKLPFPGTINSISWNDIYSNPHAP
jgi:hypothetical protein